METEQIDKLFLELSQFTQATTKREASLTARLAEAEEALEKRSLAETRYEELRELIACGSRSMAHEDLVSQLRVNNELIVTRDQKVADARADNERLMEACRIFRTYGLPPHDCSGKAEWKRAISLTGGKP